MNDQQWTDLLRVLDGEALPALPAGFIIDSPWLPGWAGHSILDYYASESIWLQSNLAALRRFPGAWFLPGFWSEYGMCTEPSAFGARCLWHENELPFADKILETPEQMKALRKPDVRTDGLLPLMLKRLVHARPAIEEAGHQVRFAVARGPLNIASFLMGTTEFLMAIKESPDESHAMLTTITDFLCDWVRLQKETLPTIDGIFLLDDIAGFLGKDDFLEFAAPYLKRAFHAIDAKVRFFHNDAGGLVCAPFLAELGINLFNFSFNHSVQEMQRLTGGQVTLLGNLPPRDLLAGGTPDQVREGVTAMLAPLTDRRRLIVSGGGGMSPATPTANIEAMMEAVRGA
jgi:uroporphyrinogen-III decarboxylase